MERRRRGRVMYRARIGRENSSQARKEADKRQLLEEAANIRGSLRLDKWLLPGLTFGGIAAIIGWAALAASDMREAGIVVAAGGGLAEAAAIGRSMWSAVKGNTEESLDKAQRILQIRHNIMPDEGYFDRAYAEIRRESAQRALSEALKRGEDVYDRNPFGTKFLKPPYRY